MSTTPSILMNDGHSIPALGLGVWRIPEGDTARIVAQALGLGYRMIDGAAIYGNEAGVGEGLRRSGLPRSEVFVTTKVWNTEQGFDSTLRAVEASLARLGLDHVDLCLIHWPVPQRDLYVATWRALIRLRAEGRVRSIGVSNFQKQHVKRIIDETRIRPAVNQIELHPHLQQACERANHAKLGIITQSWTPLGKAKSFGTPVIAALAAKYGKTPAQIVLRWHLDLGLSVIPRSVNPDRLAQNLDVTGFALTAEDIDEIASLDADERTGPDPATFG